MATPTRRNGAMRYLFALSPVLALVGLALVLSGCAGRQPPGGNLWRDAPLYELGLTQKKPIQNRATTRRVIRNHPGGELAHEVEQTIDNTLPIRIEGVCASSCTVWIMPELVQDVCIAPGAELRFHTPFAEDGDEPITRKEVERITQVMFNAYPPVIQQKLAVRGIAFSGLRGENRHNFTYIYADELVGTDLYCAD